MSTGKRAAILDYGMGNLRSVQRALEEVAGGADIVGTPEQVRTAGRLIVPGVGAFADAATLLSGEVGEAVREHVAAGRPTLGVCLGMQLFFDAGHEDGEHRGLGLIAGEVVPFDPVEVGGRAGLKIPHMGWNALTLDRPDCPLLAGIEPGDHVYFVHGYHALPADRSVIAATCDYGGDVVAAVWRDNVMATQFHPEKSQRVGLTMLRNFARL